MTDAQHNAREKLYGNADSWEASVPPELRAAVEHLREEFDKVHWQCGTITEKFCFMSLHIGTTDDFVKGYRDPLRYLKEAVGPAAAQRHDELIEQDTPPAIFKAFFDLYLDGVTPSALAIFRDLVEIGQMNQAALSTGYLEWAEAQTKHVIRSQTHLIELWIKRVCDVQVSTPDEDTDDRVFWRKWQAPLLIVMDPSRYQRYDAATAWDRHDLESTDGLLMHFAQAYVLHLEDHLRRMAGKAAVAIAKSPRSTAPNVSNVNTGNPRQSDEQAMDQMRPAVKNKLHRTLSRLELRRRAVIFGVLQNNVEGRSYCLALDKRRLGVPQAWLDEGCPKTYTEAYVANGFGWRKRIQDEKSRFKKKYDQTSPAERERIVEEGTMNSSNSSETSRN